MSEPKKPTPFVSTDETDAAPPASTIAKTTVQSPADRAAQNEQAAANQERATGASPSKRSASWDSKRPRPTAKRAAKASRSDAEATSGAEATHEPTATEIAAERGAPAPRVSGEVRTAQQAHIAAEPEPRNLDLSDGEILGMSLKNEVRRHDDNRVVSLLFELRDGRLVDVTARDSVLDFTVRV